jgi:hypothetical protein
MKVRDYLEEKRGWEADIKWVLRKEEVRGVDWIHTAQYTVQWRCIVNTAVNILRP